MKLTPTERHKLAEIGRRRSAGVQAVMKLGVRFAQDEDVPYYTISPEDRAVFEKALADTRYNDAVRSSTARGALTEAFNLNGNYTSALGNLPGVQFVDGVWKFLKFAGVFGEAELELPSSEGICSTPGVSDSDTWSQSTGLDSISFGARDESGNQEYTISGGYAMNREQGTNDESITDGGSAVTYRIDGAPGCSLVICKNGTPVENFGSCARDAIHPVPCPGQIASNGEFHECREFGFWMGDLKRFLEESGDGTCADSWEQSGTIPNVGPDDELSVGWQDPDGTMRCDVFPIPNDGFGWESPTPGIGNGGAGFVPDPGAGSEAPIYNFDVPEMCNIIDSLKNNPDYASYLPDPCDTPVITPTDPGGATTPIDSGNLDPGSGGQVTYPTTPPGFTDPTAPGGIGPGFQPGDEVCIDNGDGTQYCAPIDRVTPTDPGPTLDIKPTIPSDLSTDEKICYGPDAGDDPVDVIDEIGRALNDLHIESDRIIFDSECDKQLTRPMCFKAGTNKRRILNALLDLCGFCVYPQPDGNVIVGLCGPSSVHWYYHEDVDLIAWDLEYDGQEAFAFVRVFSPTYSIMIPVSTPIAVPPDKIFHMEFPLGFSQVAALQAGQTKAANLARMALPLTGFHVPLNPLLRLRDQVHIRRPTRGFNGVYMATKLVNDYDQAAYLTQGLGRWLRGETLIT